MGYNINLLWDQIVIEPIQLPIRWEILEETLSKRTYMELYQAYMNNENANDFCPSITHYQMLIIQRWCRQLQLMGYEAETKIRTGSDLATAANVQENLELEAFSNPLAKELREAGNTDTEILKILGVDLYKALPHGFIELNEISIRDELSQSEGIYQLTLPS